jgi:FAD/FMN-containing dehydrogenase
MGPMGPADGIPLETALSGEVILPGTPGYDHAYRSLNARFDDVRPQAMVRCTNPGEVAEAVRLGGGYEMAVGVRGGAHCFAGRSSTRGLLVDVSPMRSVEISGSAVTVGGGTLLGEVYDSLLERGLTVPAGSCPSVGLAGFALGGGLGIIGRKHGLTSDHLLGVRIVLADGRVVECDDHHEADLFWALRGGGPGNFGVVVDLTFRTMPPPDATNFHLTWPVSRAAALIEAWQSWAPAAPDELAASLVIGAGPLVDEPASVEVFGVMLGTESDTDELIAPLVAVARSEPSSMFREHMSFQETVRYWGQRAAREEDPPGEELRGCRFIKSEFFDRPLSGSVVEALVGTFLEGRVAGQSRELDFSPWGGGYNRVPADATAFVHREDRFWLKHAVEVATGATSAEQGIARDWVTRSWEVVHPSGTGRVFPNFPDPDLEDWARAYYGANLERLLEVKGRYDPGNVFRFHQSLPLP